MNEIEKTEFAQKLYTEARAILEDDKATPESKAKVPQMIADAQKALAEVEQLKQIAKNADDMRKLDADNAGTRKKSTFSSLGQFLVQVAAYGDARNPQRGLMPKELEAHASGAKSLTSDEPEEKEAHPYTTKGGVKSAWGGSEAKTMFENVGASGGFLVPDEYIANLLAVETPYMSAFDRATKLPMRRRQVSVPVLDQTGATAGVPSWFGGVQARWTEEGAYKYSTEPDFRKITLTAHKLACRALVTDELLEDNAIGLEAFLTSKMGFAGAIAWQREWAFLRGTGAGMPQGIVGAGATINVVPQQQQGFTLADSLNMLEAFMPSGDGVWIFHQRHLSNVYGMTDGNGNLVFTPNVNDKAPGKLWGYPVLFSDKLPAPGNAGSALLIDPAYYYYGDRGSVAIASTNAEYFSYDTTTVRAVYRVDGQPGLSAPITLEDGATTISPFVQLGVKLT